MIQVDYCKMRKIIKNKLLRVDNNGNHSIIDDALKDNIKSSKHKKKILSSNNKAFTNHKKAVKKRNIVEYAAGLERNLPKSEIWFREKYLSEPNARVFKGKHWVDCFNKPFKDTYIPDVLNIGYRYIIEIDGSVHSLPEVQLKDRKRDYFFQKRGYLVLRIEAYNEDSYRTAMTKLVEHINKINKLELERRKPNERRKKAWERD